MSATLVARGLTLGYGALTLATDLELTVAPGDVVGLTGPNGAGKSTLLRVLAGRQAPEAGSVRRSPASSSVGYLPQEPDRHSGETLGQFLARRTGVSAAQAELETATRALELDPEGAADRYADAFEAWLALGAADLGDRVPQVLADLGLDTGPDAAMTGLSGGQAARANLACLLLARFEVFLLDEPTNDLDLDGLARLEALVAGLRAGVVLVSHDREFLARTVTSVLELDPTHQRSQHYAGGYTSYLAERDRDRAHAREAYEDYAGTKAELEERARTIRAWADKGVKAARGKNRDPDKNIAHRAGQSAEKQAGKARQADRAVARLDVVEEPRKQWQLQYSIAVAPRSGSVVATLTDAVVHLGSPATTPNAAFRLGPVTLAVGWAERVVVTGPNGSGKTTLLRALLGRQPLTAGSQALGPGVVVGEVDQARGLFTGWEPLAAAFERLVPDWPTADVRTLLAKFGLKAAHVARGSASLSPGERTRAALALLQARGVNCLVLDEPTNHLDLPAIEQLESALADYPGTLLLVTHDRRMLQTVTTTRQLRLSAGHVTDTLTGT